MTIEEAIEMLVNATYSREWAGNEELTEAYHMSIEALEKQIPKKPVYKKENSYLARCPNCDCPVNAYWSGQDCVTHCERCGQAVQLESEEYDD